MRSRPWRLVQALFLHMISSSIISNMSRERCARTETRGRGEEVAVIPGRGGDDDRNTQHQSSRSKRRLLVADRPPLFFPWKLSAAPACFVRYQPAVREWLIASGLAHSSVQWNWQLTKLPPYRHASKRKGEIRLDEWPARLGSRRPGRKDWTATCVCCGRRPAPGGRQGAMDSLPSLCGCQDVQSPHNDALIRSQSVPAGAIGNVFPLTC